jgi:hypothetical protein
MDQAETAILAEKYEPDVQGDIEHHTEYMPKRV